MNRLRLRFKCWREWNRSCSDGKIHKLLVLFNLAKSPTFEYFYEFEKFRYSCMEFDD